MKIRLLVILLLFSSAAGATPVLMEPATAQKLLGAKNVVFVDMSGDLQYHRFHVPGAVQLPYSSLVYKRKHDKVSVRVPDDYLYKILGALGISRDTHVIIYDDMGGLHAGRLFWELERIGHKRVSVINGGIVSWILEKRPVNNVLVKPLPVRYLASGGGRANEADLGMVLKRGAGVQLLDVRTEQEYRGHPRFKRTGHIPGARWLSWDTSLSLARGFRMKTVAKLGRLFEHAGISRDKPVIVYCRSGHRAAQTYLTLRSLGFRDVRLYDASMAEYSRRPQMPLKLGVQP